MNQNTETWEEQLSDLWSLPSIKWQEALKSFIRTEIDRARQQGRDEAIASLRSCETMIRGLYRVTNGDLEAARQHKEG